MLGKQGILTEQEMNDIITTLQEIKEDVESGKLEITSEYEDIHSFVEANLIDRLGDTGKNLHTGRSRNDQVALDMRLYIHGRGARGGRTVKRTSFTILHIYGRKYRDDHAGLYPSAESTADHWHIIWVLTLRCLSVTVCVCMIFMSA